MTGEQREAIVERAAIMEYEGGLDRKAATLAAFALYFPGDYRAMKEAAAALPDGETAIYEFVEGLLKQPGTAIGEATMHMETKNTETYGNAPDGPPMAKETPPMKAREGPEALAYITGKGIALIGVYESGAAIAKGEAWAAAFTTDMKIINTLRAGEDNRAKGTSITRFYFIPQAAGLVCLDIDRKNGKDGINEFYSWAEKAGKPRHLLPQILQDIEGGSFPCYTKTPSGGYHLYLSYSGEKLQKKTLAPETPGVEIMHGAPGLASPGSYKEGKPYILHGEIENAPPLPAFILAAIEPPKPKAAAYIPNKPGKKEWGRPSWDKIRDWTETDGAGAGRNDRAFNLARHARNHGYTESETIDALRGEPGLDGLPEKEIETAVHSAFSKGRKSA